MYFDKLWGSIVKKSYENFKKIELIKKYILIYFFSSSLKLNEYFSYIINEINGEDFLDNIFIIING